ncbi:MAG TPA: ABC transporter permease subunit [Pirellulales bacterium]|jgi:iron(III) transport system permease protein
MNRSRPTAQALILLILLGIGAVAAFSPSNSRGWLLAANTAQLAAWVCGISVPLGTLLALVLARTDVPGRRAFLLALSWLLFLPLYLQVGAWQAGFGLQGWQTLSGFGPPWLDGWRGAVWVHAAAAIPWVVLIVSIGLRNVRPELEESALLDASAWHVFYRVTLRHAAPLVVAATLWVAIGVAGEIAVTDLFQIRTYAEELYTEMAIGAAPHEAPLRALPGIAITAWAALAGIFIIARFAPRERQVSIRPRLIFLFGVWRWPLAVLMACAVLLLVGLPLVNLAWKCGVVVVQSTEGRERHWSLLKGASIVASSPLRFGREIRSSLVVGSVAATATVVLATMLAWSSRCRSTASAILISVIVLGLAVPGPVIGLCIIWMFNTPHWNWAHTLYDRTILPPVCAQTIRALPLACLVLWHAFHTLPTSLMEAAALDGANAWTTFRRVALPQRRFTILISWWVALAVAVGEMGATILVTPPGIEPLSVRISGLLHYGVEDQVAGICLALALAFIVLSALLVLLANRWTRTAGSQDRH